MQNAKDTFYEVLRDRVAAADAELTVVVRGVLRPAVVVDENESAKAAEWRDCFRLRWVGLNVDADGPAARVAMQCEIRYATAGNAVRGGIDRGRTIAKMDSILIAAINTGTQFAVKKNFSALVSGGGVAEMNSRIWWSDVRFEALTESEGELQRTATVEVWSYQESEEAGAA